MTILKMSKKRKIHEGFRKLPYTKYNKLESSINSHTSRYTQPNFQFIKQIFHKENTTPNPRYQAPSPLPLSHPPTIPAKTPHTVTELLHTATTSKRAENTIKNKYKI
jgi:hypothetical protein